MYLFFTPQFPPTPVLQFARRKNRKKEKKNETKKTSNPRTFVEFPAISILFYRKIHYLTREFQVKLHAKTDIARPR